MSSSSPLGQPSTSARPSSPPANLESYSFKDATLDDVLEDLSSRFILNLPEEELASIERICFQVEQAHWFYEDFIREENPSFPSLPLKRFSAMLFHACPLLKQWSHEHETAFENFMRYKTRVPVCGAIMVNPGWDKCVLVKGWKSSSGWGFPKGKINHEEPESTCAIREVYEETGYDITDKLIEELVIKLTIKEQQITLYVIPDVPEDTAFQTRTRKEISKIDWFKLLDLPTWKRNRAQANGRFYLISPFVGPLKQIVLERKRQEKASQRSSKAKQASNYTADADDEDDFSPSQPNAHPNARIDSEPEYSSGSAPGAVVHAGHSSQSSSATDPVTPADVFGALGGGKGEEKDHLSRLLTGLTLSASSSSDLVLVRMDGVGNGIGPTSQGQSQPPTQPKAKTTKTPASSKISNATATTATTTTTTMKVNTPSKPSRAQPPPKTPEQSKTTAKHPLKTPEQSSSSSATKTIFDFVSPFDILASPPAFNSKKRASGILNPAPASVSSSSTVVPVTTILPSASAPSESTASPSPTPAARTKQVKMTKLVKVEQPIVIKKSNHVERAPLAPVPTPPVPVPVAVPNRPPKAAPIQPPHSRRTSSAATPPTRTTSSSTTPSQVPPWTQPPLSSSTPSFAPIPAMAATPKEEARKKQHIALLDLVAGEAESTLGRLTPTSSPFLGNAPQPYPQQYPPKSSPNTNPNAPFSVNVPPLVPNPHQFPPPPLSSQSPIPQYGTPTRPHIPSPSYLRNSFIVNPNPPPQPQTPMNNIAQAQQNHKGHLLSLISGGGNTPSLGNPRISPSLMRSTNPTMMNGGGYPFSTPPYPNGSHHIQPPPQLPYGSSPQTPFRAPNPNSYPTLSLPSSSQAPLAPSSQAHLLSILNAAPNMARPPSFPGPVFK